MKIALSHSSISYSFFFLSQNHQLHSSHSIFQEVNLFWGFQKNLTPKDKNAHIIWDLLGLTYMGHPPHERETQPNNSLVPPNWKDDLFLSSR